MILPCRPALLRAGRQVLSLIVMTTKRNNIFTIVLLSVYALILVWIVLLKASTVADLKYLPCPRTLNLIPFHYDIEVGTHFEEVVLNALVFVPLGLYLAMLGMKAWKAIPYRAMPEFRI